MKFANGGHIYASTAWHSAASPRRKIKQKNEPNWKPNSLGPQSVHVESAPPGPESPGYEGQKQRSPAAGSFFPRPGGLMALQRVRSPVRLLTDVLSSRDITSQTGGLGGPPQTAVGAVVPLARWPRPHSLRPPARGKATGPRRRASVRPPSLPKCQASNWGRPAIQ